MKHQQFNLISILGAVVAGVFGAFPVTVHANKSPLIAMIAGGVGGTLPVPVHANKSPLIAMVAGGVGGAIPVTVDAKKSPLVALAAGVGISTLPVTVHAGDNKCTKGDYGCGKGIGTEPYWTETCAASQCCCRAEDFGGYRHATCSGYESETKGCDSCLGWGACTDVASTVKIGDQSCVNDDSCFEVSGNSIIWNHSCRAIDACSGANNVVIGPNSCGIGKNAGDSACQKMEDSTVGSNSCGASDACYWMTDSTVGSNSCGASDACYGMYRSTVGSNSCGAKEACSNNYLAIGDNAYLSIGDNACNLEYTCYQCASGSTVPNGACSTSGAADVTGVTGEDPDPNGTVVTYEKCKYCIANYNMATVSASYTTSTRRRLESADEDLEKDCKALALALLDYTDQSISEYAAFRDFIRGDACNGKYNNVFEFIADAFTGTCSINLNQLWSSRPTIGDELPGKEYIGNKIQEFEELPPILQGFTLTSLAATDEEFECESDVSIKSIKSGKSGKTAPAQAQIIDDGGSKSGKSGSGKEEPKRKRRRQPSK